MKDIIFFFTLHALVTVILIVAACQDIRYRRINNWLSATIVLLAFVRMLHAHSIASLWGIVPSFFIYLCLYRSERIGGGDIKLIAGMGLYLGLFPCMTVIAIACTGALFMQCMKRLFKPPGQAQSIPFCAWLAVGGISLVMDQIVFAI